MILYHEDHLIYTTSFSNWKKKKIPESNDATPRSIPVLGGEHKFVTPPATPQEVK